MIPISLFLRASSRAWLTSSAVCAAWPCTPTREKPWTASGLPMTNTFIGRLPVENQEGDDEAVDGDAFAQADEDERAAKGFGLFGDCTNGRGTGAADGDARANCGQTGGDGGSQRCVLVSGGSALLETSSHG